MGQIHIVEQVNGACPEERRIRQLGAFTDVGEARGLVRRLRARFSAAADRADELAAFCAQYCREHPFPDAPGRARKAWERAYDKARGAFLRSIGIEDEEMAAAIVEYDEWDPPSFRVTALPLLSGSAADRRRQSAVAPLRATGAAGAARASLPPPAGAGHRPIPHARACGAAISALPTSGAGGRTSPGRIER